MRILKIHFPMLNKLRVACVRNIFFFFFEITQYLPNIKKQLFTFDQSTKLTARGKYYNV